jgi:hypothetical protein
LKSVLCRSTLFLIKSIVHSLNSLEIIYYLNVCIPEARTKNVAKIMNSLLKYSAQEALKLVKDENQDKTESKKAIKAFLANAVFKLK